MPRSSSSSVNRSVIASDDDVDNVDIENKYEDEDKTGRYNDVDDDQTFESSGKVSKRAPHQADQRVVS